MCGDGLEPVNGHDTNGTTNGTTTNGTVPVHRPRLPYQSVGDALSNTKNFKIIESTLREGEQFANAFYDTGISLPP
jgi:homocitrate synthase